MPLDALALAVDRFLHTKGCRDFFTAIYWFGAGNGLPIGYVLLYAEAFFPIARDLRNEMTFLESYGVGTTTAALVSLPPYAENDPAKLTIPRVAKAAFEASTMDDYLNLTRAL